MSYPEGAVRTAAPGAGARGRPSRARPLRLNLTGGQTISTAEGGQSPTWEESLRPLAEPLAPRLEAGGAAVLGAAPRPHSPRLPALPG